MYEKLYLEGNAHIRWTLLRHTGGGNEACIIGDCAAWYCFELNWGKGFQDEKLFAPTDGNTGTVDHSSS